MSNCAPTSACLTPCHGLLRRYRRFFDFDDTFPIVSLEEGGTPLIPAPGLAHWLAAKSHVTGLKVFLKFEGLNPTGSFKDRGMTYAVSRAKDDGATHILCASTGNTSASAAAYGARAGLKTLVIVPAGKIALGKLSQAMMYGATIVEIEGNFDQALEAVRLLGSSKVAIVNSINPYRIEGQKTAAFEVCDVLAQLGVAPAPDALFIPVGNAGNITAYWKGFCEYQAAGIIAKTPRMMGYEAEGSAAIVQGKPISNPETIATAIRIGNPASWQQAVAAQQASGGHIGSVSDAQIIEAYQQLALTEGVLCEPSSAASVAGLLQACKQGQVAANETIVCVLTGNGLKDPDSAMAYSSAQRIQTSADPTAIRTALGL